MILTEFPTGRFPYLGRGMSAKIGIFGQASDARFAPVTCLFCMFLRCGWRKRAGAAPEGARDIRQVLTWGFRYGKQTEALRVQ